MIGTLSELVRKWRKILQERMSVPEKILFTSQLASMIKAGLPMIDALATFLDEKSRRESAVIISKIMQDVQAGMKLSDSLARFPNVFNTAYLAIVRAGESSGTLDESLTYLADLLRRENALLVKIRSALIYPAVVVTAMAAVLIFISVSILPKILTFAESSGQKLPVYTLALIGLTTFFENYWYIVIVSLLLFIIGMIVLSRTSYGSRMLGGLSLRLPIIGNINSKYNQARFARVLAGFYIYGVNIVTSFDTLAQSLSNPLYKEACVRIKERLSLGQSLSEAIGYEKELFPGVMTRLIKGAEKTGNIGGTLDKLARYYEEELETTLANVLVLIEPILVFILGFGVLGLSLAVILPIYQVTSSLR